MLLKELFLKEDDRSTAVFAFGRFNPPTIGHEKLIETVLATAKTANAKPYLFLSHKQNNKTDPLSFNEKQEYIQALYPNLAVGDAGSNTIIKVLQKIQSEGRTKIIMVAGSDRVEEFSKLLNQYNGKPDKQGNDLYKFDSISVANAGQRDPDAEGVTGMSASKMRAAAGSGDYDSFKLGLPKGYDGIQLFNDVRKGMGITREIKPFKPVSEMNDIEFVREQYFQNLLFTIGEWVEDVKNGYKGEVVKRGTNYVTIVQEDFSLHKVWLEDARQIESQSNKLPDAIHFIKNRNLWEKYRREAYEAGTPEYLRHTKKITPGEKVKMTKESVSKLAQKFKLPMNVASAIYKKMMDAGLNPLKIQSYASMLSTYLNLMDQKVPEVAPPGKEKVVKALKKKFDDPSAPYAIAWAQYNKEKNK